MNISKLNWHSWKAAKEKIKRYQKKFDVSSLLMYSRNKNEIDYQETLANANRLKNNIFTYRKPLDMEPCHIPYKVKSMDLKTPPNGDPEWLFMLHRQEYLKDLIIAYFETKEPIFLEKWKELVLGWIQTNPLDKETKQISWRTIDTGIRCLNWCETLLLILPLDILTEEEEKNIMSSIREQLVYIYESYIDKYDLSNWGVLQTAGLLVCELWFGNVLQLELKEWALKKLNIQLFLQVNENGVHWEQSPLYQYETLYYFLSVVHHNTENNCILDQNFIDHIRKLAYNSAHLLQPNEELLPQSDTDQSNVSYILNYAEVILNVSFNPFQQKNKGHTLVAWMVGWEKFASYLNRLFSSKMTTYAYDNKTGNSWSRTNWTDQADFLSVHSGPVGSGHGHLDLGHFNYTYQGIPVFIDSGRYSYTEGPIRTYLKSAKAHNTIIVDHQNFSEAIGAWKYGKTAVPQSFHFIEKENISTSECVYTARMRDNSPYTVRRRYVFIKDLSALLIFDFVIANGNHSVSRLFHTSTQALPAKISEKKWQIQTRNGLLDQHFFDNTQTALNNTFISPVYNSIANTEVIHAISEFRDYGSFLTVIAPESISVYTDTVKQSGTTKSVDALHMKAVVLESEKKYIILNGQLDTVHGHKLYKYNDLSFYGRLNIVQGDGNIKRFL